MTVISATTPFVPSLQNHFGVTFGDPRSHDNVKIKEPLENPYASKINNAYVPHESDLPIVSHRTFQEYKKDPKSLDTSGAIFITYESYFNHVAVYLDLKDLANFSQTSKCCYLASKANGLWDIQFSKRFPHTLLMPKEKCGFSKEQQFKIYFKRHQDHLKIYKTQQDINQLVLDKLVVPNGNDGICHEYQMMYQELGGERELRNALCDALNAPKTDAIPPIIQVITKRNVFQSILKKLAGPNYDGTVASIDSNSQQARCLFAIENLPGALDNQVEFENWIQKSHDAKNKT